MGFTKKKKRKEKKVLRYLARKSYFAWSSEPREGLAACSTNRVSSFFSYFKTMSIGRASGIELTWDQAFFFFFFFFLFFFFFFFFLLLCFFRSRGKKNNAWYIHLTSRLPPPNLHNLTSPWPVTLLANKRLPYGNQILPRIMSLLKSILIRE